MRTHAGRFTLMVETREGRFTAIYSERGLRGLAFPEGKGRRSEARVGPGVPREVRTWHKLTAKAVALVLAGRAVRAMPPLDMGEGTAFQQAVWAALTRIPRGRTATYREVAAAIGRPRSARAVGQACGANPVPLLVPCHRVVATGGGLGGFSGGLRWKQMLLAREGAGGPAS